MGASTDRRVELVFFDGCPHLDQVRAAISSALEAAGRPLVWSEFRTDDPSLPTYAEGFGSPSIFVGGREITGAARTGAASSCCVYSNGEGGRLSGAPSSAL